MKLKRILGLLSTLAGVGIFSVCAYAGTVTVEDAAGAAGSSVNVNVYISPSEEGKEESLNGFSVNLVYDSDVLTPAAVGTDITGAELYAAAADSISSGVFVAAPSEEGTLAAAWAMDSAVTYSEKTLLYTVTFAIADSASGSSTVSLNVTSLTTDGSILLDADALAEYAAEGTVTIGEDGSLRGDANGDSTVDSSDASLILRSLVELDAIESENKERADANADDTIDSADASLILRSLVGLDEISD